MCAGSGGSVSRDNVRFLVIGKAVWEPPQAREWAPGYVLCVRVHGLSGQDGPRVRVPGTASRKGV